MRGKNSLFEALPQDVRDRLTKLSRIKELAQGEVLQRPGAEILSVYFPIDCLISITVTMGEAQTAEAGIVGSREMVGLNAVMGGRETTQTEYICQFPGTAMRVPADIILKEFDESKAVRDVLLKYTQAYIAQLSQNVACNRLHTVDQRLPRWLLECRDRLQTDNFGITHEYISHMLGVRRAGITDATKSLQQRGIIDSSRGTIRIADLPALETASCECFRVILNQYNDLLTKQL